MKKTAIAISLALASTFAHADDFSETLDNARQAYEEGDISGAKEELEYATQLLGQMRSKALQSFLPEALDGWDRKDSKSQSSNGGIAMLGGGTTAEAKYQNGKDRVTVSIIADSPMVQGMGMVFSRMGMAGASGGEMKRINRQKVMVKKNSLMTMIDKRIIVEVKGRSSMEDKEAYFKQIDFKGLKSF